MSYEERREGVGCLVTRYLLLPNFKSMSEKPYSRKTLKKRSQKVTGHTLSCDDYDSNSNFSTKWFASEERKGVRDCGVK